MLRFLEGKDINWSRWDGDRSPKDAVESAFNVHKRSLLLLKLADKYEIPSLRNEMLSVMLRLLPVICQDPIRPDRVNPGKFFINQIRPFEDTFGQHFMASLIFSAPWQRLIICQWIDPNWSAWNVVQRYSDFDDGLLNKMLQLRKDTVHLFGAHAKQTKRALRHLSMLIISFAI